MAAPVRVAWISRQEWEAVKSCVLSNDVSLWQEAVDRIQLWKCRVGHKLSDSIELTQMLILNLIKWESACSSPQEQELLRPCFSMTIMRFVSAITDAIQARLVRRPVHVLAQQAGIPLWIVELRHDAAHAKMPSLPLLVKALQFAFSYLKDWYWNHQDSNFHSLSDFEGVDCVIESAFGTTIDLQSSETEHVSSSAISHRLQDVIVDYQRFQYNRSSGSSHEASDLLQENADFICQNKKAFFDVLCEEGYLLLNAEQLQAMELSHLVSLQEAAKLPRRLVSFWKPVLAFVDKAGLKGDLILALASSLTDAVCLRNWQIIAWIGHLIKAKGNQPADRSSNDIHWTGLVAHLMNKMSPLVVSLARLVINMVPSLHGLRKAELVDLAQTYVRGCGSSNRSSSSCSNCAADAICTADDVLRKVQESASKSTSTNAGSRWRLASCDANWATIPLGHVFCNCEGAALSQKNPHSLLDPTVHQQLQHRGDEL